MHDDDKKKLFHIKKTSLNAFNLIEIDLFPYIKSYDWTVCCISED